VRLRRAFAMVTETFVRSYNVEVGDDRSNAQFTHLLGSILSYPGHLLVLLMSRLSFSNIHMMIKKNLE